jgi:hypothetical protein
MAWTSTTYLQFADQPTAEAAVAALGMNFPADWADPAADDDYVLVGPITEWATPPTITVVAGVPTVASAGTPRSGFWMMAKFNEATTTGAAIYAQLQAQYASAIQTLASPDNTFAGDP